MDAPLCINCRHYQAHRLVEYDRCTRVDMKPAIARSRSLVRGGGLSIADPVYCDMERSTDRTSLGSDSGRRDACGPSGRFFEAREQVAA